MQPNGNPQATDLVKVSLEYFQTDLQRWRKELEFTCQELDRVNHRIEDMVALFSDTDFLTDLKHYQNPFTRKHELANTLLHKVELDKKETARLAEDPYTLDEHFNMQKHRTLGNEILLFSRLYTDLWHAFNKFLLIKVFLKYVNQKQ